MKVILIAVALAAAACGSDDYGSDGSTAGCTPASAVATTSISLQGNQFVPSCVRISPGATVTFTHADGAMVHTVTTDAGQPETFGSANLTNGQQFVHTFAAVAETVNIHCVFHPSMVARIFVQ